MSSWPHLIILPIVLPLLAGAAMLLLEPRRPGWTGPLSLAATAAQLLIAGALLLQADGGAIQAYLVGNWPAPYGITLVLDRLAALMLLLTGGIAFAALLHARRGDEQRGAHFQALFQFQLMGLNGAFLTGDLFNLFVFFEVLLAASYGLLLHGGGARRLKAAVHYVVFNLAASALFLIAASLLYGVAGTLNLADLAQRLPALMATGGAGAALAQSGVLLLIVVFAVKAALLPLYFWLPETYAAATAPVAALFAIMTKVGVYAIVRVCTLLLAGGGAHAQMVLQPLTVLALLTLVLAAAGALAAQTLRTLIAYLLIASVGTLLLGVGLGTAGALAAALFYLVNTTLAAAAWFLLAERLRRHRGGLDALQALPMAARAQALGPVFFVLAIAAAGVPPLGGFLGKALLIRAAGTTPWAGVAIAAVLASSLLMIVALARAGVTVFWQAPVANAPAGAASTVAPAGAASAVAPAGPSSTAATAAPPSPAAAAAAAHAAQPDSTAPASPASASPSPADPPRRAALALLLIALLALAPAAGRIEAYARDTAAQLQRPSDYLGAVFGQQPAPPAHDVRREMRERGDAK
jgi:multicomponent K+:H+ antiporter subunit D